MRATDFEFRNRWWLFGALFGGCFVTFAFDRVPLGVRIARALMPSMHWSEDAAARVVFGGAAAVTVLAAMLRTWGSSYLGRDVVHDHELHGESLRAESGAGKRP